LPHPASTDNEASAAITGSNRMMKSLC
jgi:hypothetical protein